VLDVRVYRTAFLPALVALFIAAFALKDRPAPAVSPLPADTFTGNRAYGNPVSPAAESLQGMARDFPSREPGSAGDNGLAARVARVLRAPDQKGERSTFQVTRSTTEARTPTGKTTVETVVGIRPGLSSRRIVVLSHRDSRERPGLADLSGTAALLELARVFKTRDMTKTLVLVSTSGATTGFAGARAWATENAGTPVDGVIVLGDMGGTRVRKPWVVSWPAAPRPVPLGLERTVQAAVRAETKSDPGGSRAIGQWVRRALGVTVSEQGPIGAAGLPATLLSMSGERGPDPGERVSDKRLEAFGQAAVRAVSAMDAARPRDEDAFADAPHGIVTMRNVLPDWAVRLVILMLLLPALLAAVDAFFRVRRRRLPVAAALRRVAIGAVPILVGWVWLRLLGATGLLAATDGAVLPDAYPLDTAGLVAVGSAALIAALAWYAARRLLARPAAPDSHAIATGLAICALTSVVWLVNPYAAALLLPAMHLWLFAAGGWGARAGFAAIVGGLALPILAVVYLGAALALSPVDFGWASTLAVAGGHGFWTALVLAGLFAALGGLVRVLLSRGRVERERVTGGSDIRTRGPLTYAGPGSLGGTESALRR
jgi:Peptidase family M28